MAEIWDGILGAVIDNQQFDGNLQLDVVDKEEICVGMGGRNFIDRKSEDIY